MHLSASIRAKGLVHIHDYVLQYPSVLKTFEHWTPCNMQRLNTNACGYLLLGTIAFRDAFYGEGTGPIFLERYDCDEDDTRFLDCAERPIGDHTCDHSNDAGVKCIGEMISGWY